MVKEQGSSRNRRGQGEKEGKQRVKGEVRLGPSVCHFLRTSNYLFSHRCVFLMSKVLWIKICPTKAIKQNYKNESQIKGPVSDHIGSEGKHFKTQYKGKRKVISHLLLHTGLIVQFYIFAGIPCLHELEARKNQDNQEQQQVTSGKEGSLMGWLLTRNSPRGIQHCKLCN